MKETILELINEFLVSKEKPTVKHRDTLYSSGLLDSFDMVELILFLQSKSFIVTPEVDGTNFIMSSIDSPEKIEKIGREKI